MSKELIDGKGENQMSILIYGFCLSFVISFLGLFVAGGDEYEEGE